MIQQFEEELKDSTKDSPVTGRSLNSLNTKLSELRTRLQYMDASIDTILGAFENPSTTSVIDGAIPDVKRLGGSVLVENGSYYFHPLHYFLDGIDGISGRRDSIRKASVLKEVCRQRLLVVEGIQQRLNISLSVVSNLLASRENHWNRRMASSQKIIAMLTMLFLPATFFAVVFTVPLFNWDTTKPEVPVVSPKIWIYLTLAAVFTGVLFFLYWLWGRNNEKEEKRDDIEEANAMRGGSGKRDAGIKEVKRKWRGMKWLLKLLRRNDIKKESAVKEGIRVANVGKQDQTGGAQGGIPKADMQGNKGGEGSSTKADGFENRPFR